MNYRELVEKLSSIELEAGPSSNPAPGASRNATTEPPDITAPKSNAIQTQPSDNAPVPNSTNTPTNQTQIPGQQPDIGHGSKIAPQGMITPQGTQPAPNTQQNDSSNELKSQIYAIRNAINALSPQQNQRMPMPPAMQPTTSQSVSQQQAVAQKNANMADQPKPGEPTIKEGMLSSIVNELLGEQTARTPTIQELEAQRDKNVMIYHRALTGSDPEKKKKAEEKLAQQPEDFKKYFANFQKWNDIIARNPQFLDHDNFNGPQVSQGMRDNVYDVLVAQKPHYKEYVDAQRKLWDARNNKDLTDEVRARAATERAEALRRAMQKDTDLKNQKGDKSGSGSSSSSQPPAQVVATQAKADGPPPATQAKADENKPKSWPEGVLGRGIGMTGKPNADVEALQQKLKDAGYTLKVDGRYGPETEKIVRLFQTEFNKNASKDKKIKVDGIAGGQTQPLVTQLASVAKQERLASAEPEKTESDFDKAERLRKEQETASKAQLDALIKQFREANPSLKYDASSLSFQDAGGPTHQIFKGDDGKWVIQPNTTSSGRSIDAPPPTETNADKLAREKREREEAERIAKEKRDREAASPVANAVRPETPSGAKNTSSVVTQADNRSWWERNAPNFLGGKDLPGQEKTGFGNMVPIPDNRGGSQRALNLTPWNIGAGQPVQRNSGFANQGTLASDAADIRRAQEHDVRENMDFKVDLSLVVEEILHEGGATGTLNAPASSTNITSKVKNAASSAIDTAKNTASTVVNNPTVQAVAKHPVTKAGLKAADWGFKGLSGIAAINDVGDAVDYYNKGDNVGATLKGIAAAGDALTMARHPFAVGGGMALKLGADWFDDARKNWNADGGIDVDIMGNPTGMPMVPETYGSKSDAELEQILNLSKYKLGK